jgi:predicted SprT family Zn-dependent metalloprotease
VAFDSGRPVVEGNDSSRRVTDDNRFCPSCKCEDVWESRPRPRDWLKTLFGKKAYRCRSCGRRFFAPQKS